MRCYEYNNILKQKHDHTTNILVDIKYVVTKIRKKLKNQINHINAFYFFNYI